MSRTQIKNGNIIWQAFMNVCIMRPFGGAGWATTAQIAKVAGKSKPTVARYMALACEAGSASAHILENRQVVWVWEK